MQVNIIKPDQDVFSGEAKEILVPGISGYLGILNNHAPLITVLKAGQIKLTADDGTAQLFDINGGVLEVQNNKVIVLAE